jgi:hypothetical protein
MMGTFATVLAINRIPTPEDRFRAAVTGDIEDVDGVLKITRILVRYSLKLKSELRPGALSAFQTYLPYCPAAQSVIGAIRIDHELQMEDM